jgi:hypothetical protein
MIVTDDEERHEASISPRLRGRHHGAGGADGADQEEAEQVLARRPAL